MNKPIGVVSAVHFRQLLEASKLLGQRELDEFSAIDQEDAKSGARFLVKKGWLTKWQAGQLLGGFHRLVVGNYRLVQELGRGYWGRVYLADHGRLRKRVAVKVLSPQLTAHAAYVERFLVEARLAATLEHPNLIQVYDAGHDGERTYVVMEYVSGTDLRQHVQKHGAVALRQVTAWALQVADACEYLHGCGAIHGRLRPSSLMVTEANTIKILGVAAWSRPSQEAGEAEVIDGYLASEQALHSVPNVRSDVYSLGRTMHFLLSGRPPQNQPVVPGDRAGATEDSALLAEALPNVPAELLRILGRMTANDPEARFSGMGEVAAALELLCSEHQVSSSVVVATAQSPAAFATPSVAGESDVVPPRTDSVWSSGGKPREASRPGRVPLHQHRRVRTVSLRIAIGLAVAVCTLAAIGTLWMCVRVVVGA